MNKKGILFLMAFCLILVARAVSAEGPMIVNDYFAGDSLCSLDEYSTSLAGMSATPLDESNTGFYLYDSSSDTVSCKPFSYSNDHNIVYEGVHWHADTRPYMSGEVSSYREASSDDIDKICFKPLTLVIYESGYPSDFDGDGITDEIYTVTAYYVNESNKGLYSSDGECVQSGIYTAKIKYGTWQVVESHAGASIEGLTCWDDVQNRINGHIWQTNGYSQNGECNYCTKGGYEQAEKIQKCGRGYCAYKQEDYSDSYNFYEWIKCFPQSSTFYIDDRTCHIDWASSTSYYQQYYGFDTPNVIGASKWGCNYAIYENFNKTAVTWDGANGLDCFVGNLPAVSAETAPTAEYETGLTFDYFAKRLNARAVFLESTMGENLICSQEYSLHPVPEL